MFKRGDYPKSLQIGDESYRIRFVRKLPGKGTVGECDPSDKEIRIRTGLGASETFSTCVHEILHALEFEYDLPIPHKLIYGLEEALVKFFKNNF